ncbi:uncharacterized protein [Hemitrygon akajei]|uniref:uncharacterized protein isoform X2 n=1 Tax=Hemitrygon akajei TaxID=2704970 RepID=UPI003BFA05BE
MSAPRRRSCTFLLVFYMLMANHEDSRCVGSAIGNLNSVSRPEPCSVLQDSLDGQKGLVLTETGSQGLVISGRKFLAIFLENHSNTAILALNIITYEKAANVNVSISVPPFFRAQTIGASNSAVVNLEPIYMLKGNEISKKVITITADEDISVVVLNTRYNTQDAYLNLPVVNLGTTYFVVTYNGFRTNHRQFAIANGNENVQVTVTVAGAVVYNGIQYSDKQKFTFNMEPNQTTQFQSEVDLTGTKVVSSKPVAVFSGNRCIMISSTDCDHVAEQLFPVDKWSYSFAVFPLLNKETTDLVTVIAGENDTAVSIYSEEGNVNFVLQEGSHINLTVNGGMIVNSAKAVMVTYLSTGGSNKLVPTFDPFLMNVIPSAYFNSFYVFVTFANFYNYILIISSTPNYQQIVLDGKPLSSYPSENTTFWDFTATRIYLGKTAGRYVIMHTDALFGIYVYGIARGEAYGYSIGGKSNNADLRKSASFICMTQAAEYTFPSSVLTSAGVALADVHLIDPTCKARQQDENWVVITAPFNSCGTTISNETGKIIYINTIYGSVPSTSVHRLEIELKCEMAVNESVRMGFMLQTNHLVRFGHYNVSFKLFRSINYDDPVLQFPYQVELNGTLFVQMEAHTTDTGVQIFTDTCVSIPSLNTNKVPFTIIQNGCIHDVTFRWHETSDTRKQRFSFHVFKFENFPQVYIFCDLVLCHTGSSPSRCERGCIPSRRKRALQAHWRNDKAAHLSQGPVVFSTSRLGQRDLRLSSERKEAGYSMYMFGALSAICLSLLTALVLQRKYYLKQN